MKFFAAAVLSSLIAAATAAPAASPCVEAARFGVLTSVSPSALAAGDTVTITADFTCAVQNYGHIPKYADYYLEVPQNNNGYEPDLLLAHHEPAEGTLTDTFTATIPHAYYFAGAAYAIVLRNTYGVNGTDGSTYYALGGVEHPVNITTVNA